jgi:pyrroloquinoline quinone biosynthesis protein E
MSQAALSPPLGLLAELSHRCPLQCPYCSNPLELERGGGELDTATWMRVLSEAAQMGVLQVHLSGGEPTVRPDLEDLIGHASHLGLYTNLITSGVLLDELRLGALKDAGLDHVQISFQDTEAPSADRIGGFKGGHAKKLQVAGLVRKLGLPLTVNAVMHRQNVEHVSGFIELAVSLGAARLEVAHVQYYGWALKNRAALMPTRAQMQTSMQLVIAARERLKGVLAIDHVIPDYYAARPKACMGGWGRQFININPAGRVLPCHAAESIPSLKFDSVLDRPLAEIWSAGDAFQRFRGTAWMAEPCQSCERKEIDWGGCRCQAFAMLGDAAATDPACALSPRHAEILAAAERDSAAPPPEFNYRRIGAGLI